MDRQHIDNHHVVERFLADQLSDSDREAFEAYCLANPAMYREIEAVARFKAGLAKLEESNELQPLLQPAPAAQPFLLRHAAAIAGVAVLVALLYGAVVTLRVPAMGASVAEVSGKFRDVLPVVSEATLMAMRDPNPAVPEVRLPVAPGVIVLHVLPEEGNAVAGEAGTTRYQARLQRAEGDDLEVVATAEDLPQEKKSGLVHVYLRTADLKTGEYEIAVAPMGESLDDASSLRISMVAAESR